MQRAITGYRRDEERQWVAVLDCGHGRHVRHAPPASNRPWANDPEERTRRIGTVLECLKCDRSELPDTVQPYKSTPWFTEHTVPRGLLADHTTRKGTWGRVEVASGTLRFVAGPPAPADLTVSKNTPCYAVPEHPHRVVLLGPVQFRVTFLRVPGP